MLGLHSPVKQRNILRLKKGYKMTKKRFLQNILGFPHKALHNAVSVNKVFQCILTYWQTCLYYSPSSEARNVKRKLWQDNSVHLDSLWRLCLLLLGRVIVLAWVKATGFSHLLPLRGGDAERRVHLIIGLSASVFMLDFRSCPAHPLETAGVCVSEQSWSGSHNRRPSSNNLLITEKRCNQM